jgi:hypothetical protein
VDDPARPFSHNFATDDRKLYFTVSDFEGDLLMFVASARVNVGSPDRRLDTGDLAEDLLESYRGGHDTRKTAPARPCQLGTPTQAMNRGWTAACPSHPNMGFATKPAPRLEACIRSAALYGAATSMRRRIMRVPNALW